MKMKKLLTILMLQGMLFGIGLQAQDVWKESTFQDFRDGIFDDAGANMYVSHNGRIQTINRWDVNNDGNIDILFANSHPLVEMLDMSIYWGNGKDFSIKNHSYVPANGPMWVAADDLNNDGEMDLVVANYSNGTWTSMDSYVYYGGLEDKNYQAQKDEWAFYPFKKRISLPSSNAQKAAIGDFNKDGYKDIVFAFSGGFWEYRSKEGYSPSRIYWNSQDGFDRENLSNIMTRGATDVVAADLNQDGWLELVFSNGEGEDSFVYYGHQDGFSEQQLTKLPTTNPHAVEIGDVNNDDWLDIVFANESGAVSVAYLSENGKFSADRKIEFETHTAKDVVIEDFNKDGFADVFFTNHQYSLTGNPRFSNRMIDSYLYFGSQSGFSHENRQSIPTIGAWGANATDLNKDGWVDLLVCNFQEHYSYEVPSYIYWNGPDGFQLTKRTCLYEHGAQGNMIADFDGDGYSDLLITSMMGNSRGDFDPNYLYFGNDKGLYSATDRVELPGRETYEQAFVDMDDDGQVDILLINRGETTRHANELFLFWNDNNNFSPWKMDGLPVYGGIGVEVADLDRDGYLDVIVSNSTPQQSKMDDPNIGSFIYWGGPDGWPVTDRTTLPIMWTRAVAVCDINNDGNLDLVCGQQRKYGDASIFYGNGTREFNRIRIKESNGTGTPGVADLNKDGLLDIAFAHDKNVFVYYQQQNGTFPKENSTTIAVKAKTMNVADVNSDGWLDLICPYYKGNGRRSWHSTILLGGEGGYHLDHAIKLPTDGATGSIISDFNRDSYQDIFFFCHRKDGSDTEIGAFGDHHTNSLIYWGGQDGFNAENRLEIPSIGVHYDVGVDIGHIRDRGFVFEYISSPFQTNGKSPIKINWDAKTPQKTSIKFQMRAADSKEALEKAKWLGPEGPDSYVLKQNSSIENFASGEWIQYKAIFDTDNGAYSPILEQIEITLK
jgi:hypothetical protein